MLRNGSPQKPCLMPWRDHRLGADADHRLAGLDGNRDGGIRHLVQRHVGLGVELPLCQQVAGDRVRRAAVGAERDRLALEVGRPVGVLWIVALGRHEIDVAAVDAVDHRAKLRALGLGEGVVLGPANERERLAGQHRVGVAAAGLDRHDLHGDVGLGEIVVRHGDIHRQIAGRMHGLRDQQFVLCRARDIRAGDQRCARGRGGSNKFAPVHVCLLLRTAIAACPCGARFRATTPPRT